MPTFSTIPLEYLLEPCLQDSHSKPPNANRDTGPPPQNVVAEVPKPPPVGPAHIYISPALYTTPKPAPIPETYAEGLSSTPYVVNFKRRGGGGVGGDRKSNSVEEVSKVQSDFGNVMQDDHEGNGVVHRREGGIYDVQGLEESTKDEKEDFLDSRWDKMSIGSGRQFDCRSLVSTEGDYFDAVEDFLSENSFQSAESELFSVRLSLLEENGRRMDAREALMLMDNNWLRIRNMLFKAGLAFGSRTGGMLHAENASIEELGQEVVVLKFVTEAIEKDLARVEAELDAELILDSKDQEISRLQDKLRYYEAVTHEMSQRNQEIVDQARKERQRKKRQKRLFWGCIGVAIVTGISFLAYPYLPQSSQHQDIQSDLSDRTEVLLVIGHISFHLLIHPSLFPTWPSPFLNPSPLPAQ